MSDQHKEQEEVVGKGSGPKRMVYLSLLESVAFQSMSAEARVLLIHAMVSADNWGYGRFGRAAWVHLYGQPNSDYAAASVEVFENRIKEIVATGIIEVAGGEVDDMLYRFPKWDEYQEIRFRGKSCPLLERFEEKQKAAKVKKIGLVESNG